MNRIAKLAATISAAATIAVGGVAVSEVATAPSAEAALISCYPKDGMVLVAGGVKWVPGTSCYNTVTRKWEWRMSSKYNWV